MDLSVYIEKIKNADSLSVLQIITSHLIMFFEENKSHVKLRIAQSLYMHKIITKQANKIVFE